MVLFSLLEEISLICSSLWLNDSVQYTKYMLTYINMDIENLD